MRTRPEVANMGDGASLAQENVTDEKFRSLHHEFISFVNDVESLAKQSVALPYEELKGISEQLSNRVTSAKTSLEENAKSAALSLQHTGGRIIFAADQQVHERPWYFLGFTAAAAAAVGFVLGLKMTGHLED